MMRWLAYGVMTASLGAAVVLHGGVVPSEWEWTALGLSLGSLMWVAVGPSRERAPGKRWGLTAVGVLLGWMLFHLVPLPPSLVELVSPQRWHTVLAARELLHQDPGGWISLSVSPPATIERILFILPAMAVFVAAREMGWWWSERLWIPCLPVIGIAWLESLLGLVQFYAARLAGGVAAASTGTYVNRNHYSGLLGLAFPIAFMTAIAVWRRNTTRDNQPLSVAIATVSLLAVAACILMGIVLSLSRMGFIATLAASGVTLLIFLTSLGSWESKWSAWRWAIPAVVLLFIGLTLPTQELISRFADMAATEGVNRDTRAGIWRDTLDVVGNYRLTGCGIGAFEPCFYPYQTVAPANKIDFAHNDYLQILAELGIFGAALVAGLSIWILWRPLSAIISGQGNDNCEIAIGLFGSLLVLGLHGLTDFNFYIPANAVAFAWLAGIAVSPGLRK